MLNNKYTITYYCVFFIYTKKFAYTKVQQLYSKFYTKLGYSMIGIYPINRKIHPYRESISDFVPLCNNIYYYMIIA